MWPADEGSAMTTDEPASPLPSASLPTTPSSMRASYTIGTKSHSYTPPAKSSLSRSNSAASRILHPTTQDTLATATTSVLNGHHHQRQESIDEIPGPVKPTCDKVEVGASTENTAAEVEAVVSSEQEDPALATTDPSFTSLPGSSALIEETPVSSFTASNAATASSGPSGSTSSSPKRASMIRAASMKQQQTPSAAGDPVPPSLSSSSLSRHASLTLSSRRKADRDSIGGGLSLASTSSISQQQQQLPSPSPSPQTAQGPRLGHHRMLNQRQSFNNGNHSASTSISSSVGLPEDVVVASSEQDLAGMPGTPTSISSFSSLTSSSEREKSGGRLRSNRNSIALIENRNIHTLSSNLAMVQSPTKSEFGVGSGQSPSEELLSVIAQKEARIQQLREDLESNLQELAQLKDQWSKMMLEERHRQHAEATASIQQEGNGGSVSSLVSNRLSTAAIWGTVVGSVSQLSGASSGLSIHHISTYTPPATAAQPHVAQGASTPTQTSTSHAGQQQSGLASGRSSTSSTGRHATGAGGAEGGVSSTSNASRPTSPLPTYLSGFSGLHGPASPLTQSSYGKEHHHASLLTSAHQRKVGDRTSLSSQSTVSSLNSNVGDGPTAFEPGHSHTSSIGSSSVLSTSPSGSTSGPMSSAAIAHHHRDSRERQRLKRESSGMFIPVEAEEVLVNTGRAIFKGFGSLIGGIRTVVNDVAESDRFQHSRQRTLEMVNGLAQTAADALPLPSHDDIYYHHQRLHLLDEEDEEAWSRAQQHQGADGRDHENMSDALSQLRRERTVKDRTQSRQTRSEDGSVSTTLRRSASSSLQGGRHISKDHRQKELFRSKTLKAQRSTPSLKHQEDVDDTARSVDLLGIHDAPEPSKALTSSSSSSSLLVVTTGDEDEEAHNWDLDLGAEQDLLKMLDTEQTATTITATAASAHVDLLNDTPMLSTAAVAASKKNE